MTNPNPESEKIKDILAEIHNGSEVKFSELKGIERAFVEQQYQRTMMYINSENEALRKELADAKAQLAAMSKDLKCPATVAFNIRAAHIATPHQIFEEVKKDYEAVKGQYQDDYQAHIEIFKREITGLIQQLTQERELREKAEAACAKTMADWKEAERQTVATYERHNEELARLEQKLEDERRAIQEMKVILEQNMRFSKPTVGYLNPQLAKEVEEALEEYCELMQAIKDREYTPDSFTCQPARILLAKLRTARGETK